MARSWFFHMFSAGLPGDLWSSVKLSCELPFCPMVRFRWGTNSKQGLHLLRFIYYLYYVLFIIIYFNHALGWENYNLIWLSFTYTNLQDGPASPFWSCWREILSANPSSPSYHLTPHQDNPQTRLRTLTHGAHARTTRGKWQFKKLKIPLWNLLFFWWVFKCKPLSRPFHGDQSAGCEDKQSLNIPPRAEMPVYLHLRLHAHLPAPWKGGCLDLPVWFEKD